MIIENRKRTDDLLLVIFLDFPFLSKDNWKCIINEFNKNKITTFLNNCARLENIIILYIPDKILSSSACKRVEYITIDYIREHPIKD